MEVMKGNPLNTQEPMAFRSDGGRDDDVRRARVETVGDSRRSVTVERVLDGIHIHRKGSDRHRGQ